ncbi:MAG: LrgB family protein [Acinetobacter sp.]|nr:LrgB family protein [Acinetobacter sp.]MDO4224179.1 LrgB family protein [Acinetobacter sp.]
MFDVLLAFIMTFIAYLLAKPINRRFPQVPVLVIAMIWVVIFLLVFQYDYKMYKQHADDLFLRLLGYVTVALAIPLASMKYDDLPKKALTLMVLFATTSAVALPMGLAYLFHLNHDIFMAFASRAVTTPIAINIATLIHASVELSVLIVIVSGLIGSAFSSVVLRHINDERASGLALGLAAHAIGTAQAWQRSPVAGRYAAFGMAINGVVTAVWLPAFILFLQG